MITFMMVHIDSFIYKRMVKLTVIFGLQCCNIAAALLLLLFFSYDLCLLTLFAAVVEVYSVNTSSWSTAPSLNVSRADMVLGRMDGGLFAVGGEGYAMGILYFFGI